MNNTLPKTLIDFDSKPSINLEELRPSKPRFENPETEGTFAISKKAVLPVPTDIPTLIKEKELEWWLGKVTEINEDSFEAILEDRKGRLNVVIFNKKIIPPTDVELLIEGVRFTYSVSALYDPKGKTGGTEYITKLSLSARRRWSSELETRAEEIKKKFFPDDLL